MENREEQTNGSCLLVLERCYKKTGYTIGRLTYHDKFLCNTLEPQWRDYANGEKKVNGLSAIPEGTYRIKYLWSQKKKRRMPFLLDVPMFSGIMIHSGNTRKDTRGCILVGYNTLKGKVTNSASTFNKLDSLFMTYVNLGIEIFIKIK